MAGAAARARRHAWFLGLLAAGAALRVLAMLGYRPVLWFPDSYTYIVTVFHPRPDLVRPAGYSAFLRLLEPFHSFAVVAAAQHLLGLATGVLVYVAARRAVPWWSGRRRRAGSGRAGTRRAGSGRPVPPWAAALAAAPVLLDAYQVELEHLLVSDTLFMFLLVTAVVLALGGRRRAVAIGLLLAAATLTRTVGQPLIVVVAVWFVLDGRLRRAAVLLAAALIPLAAYGAWFHGTYQRTGLVGANGAFLYARTMSFADCARMDPPADLRVLCDPRPPERRPPSQEYLWAADSPLVELPGITFTKANDDLAARFATLAIRSQPLDYAASVLSELGRTFVWGRPVYPDQEIYGYYEFPAVSPPPPGRWAAQLGVEMGRRYERGPIGTEVAEPYAGWMRAYQGVARLPGTVVLVILLAPPVAGAVRVLRRRRAAGGRRPAVRPRRLPPWALPWSAAVVLLVAPPAVAEFDYRYVLPAVPLACLAAAVCARSDQPERQEFGDDIPRNVQL
ncbi:hypothetical protein HT134_13005 [Nonomuraea rhodomycinica]|uniref:Dolichyl-phosphate-mannose-protein mannosyltransferase n=1 Tax=Nonomuraea rhodomycinica TaxID=1712872 RepID=A0A7Y6IN52_9ACTN|nr:hypothetical protein [Nonomuraea rhodomycinica]